MPVPVVVDKGTTRAPRCSGTRNSSFFRDLGEDTAVVMVETVLAIVSNVEIFPPVVVVISHANSLAPPGRDQASLRGDIRKGSVMIVVVEMVGRRFICGEALQGRTIYDEDVRPPVIVIVENGNTSSGRLDNVFFGINPAEDSWRGKTCFSRDINKLDDRGERFCFLQIYLPLSRSKAGRQQEQDRRANHLLTSDEYMER